MIDTLQSLPYPGLRSFKREESYLFFGRTRCIDSMVEAMILGRFLAVLGNSGSGKSSLVRTGLIDALEMGLHPSGSRWKVIDMHPGSDPMSSLTEALLHQGPDSQRDQEDVKSFKDFLSRGPLSLTEWAKNNLAAGCNLLLLADQFEELFRFSNYAQREDAEKFVELLLMSASSTEANIHVVITMRSEYLGACSMFPELADRVSAGLFLTPQMKREEYREAIEGPARVMGFKIQPTLVNVLLNDLAELSVRESFQRSEQFERFAQGGDELPLLQHALNQLWNQGTNERGEGEIELTLHDYEAIGKLSGALEKHGDTVISSAGNGAAKCTERVFLKLISGASLPTAVRRPLRIRELVKKTTCDREDVIRIVEAFSAPECGFLRVSRAFLADDVLVDISHESLIRQWPRLRRWLANSQWSVIDLEELYRDAEMWSRRAQRPIYVKLRGERLAEIRKAYEIEHQQDVGIAKDYLEACHIRDQRDKLIDAVKGGHVSTAVAAIKELKRLKVPLLRADDLGTKPLQLKPAFWAAVTGNDHSEAAMGERSGPGTPSIYEGAAGRWEMERTASRGLTPLCWAVICEQEELVRKLIGLGDKSADPSWSFEDRDTLPGLAALAGNENILAYLVDELKMSPLTTDRLGCPPIIWAIQEGRKKNVDYLISKGQTLHVVTSEGWTALTEAARADDVDMVRSLINNESFSVNGGENHARPPLFAACLTRGKATAEVAKLLLNEFGADILVKDSEGRTCLHYSVLEDGNSSAVKVLLEYARDHNCLDEILSATAYRERTPLHWAIKGFPGATEMLLEAGALPDVLDGGGSSPLGLAAEAGDHRSARALLEWKADPNLHGPSAWPPLSVAAEAGDLDMVEMLLENNEISKDARIERQWTAAMLAASGGHTQIVLTLLKHGAPPSSVDITGRNLIAIARYNNRLELLKALETYSKTDAAMAILLQKEAKNENVSPSNVTPVRSLEELMQVYGSEVDAAAALGLTEKVKELMSAGAEEPALWRMERVSDSAWFLSFTQLEQPELDRVIPALEALGQGLLGEPANWALRNAPLTFLPGHKLLAIQHTNIPGQNEQFAIECPDGKFMLLDWTNVPIYQQMDRYTPKFDDADLLVYCRFFFHWVRGQLGRFVITDRLDQIQWTKDVTEEIRESVAQFLQPLRVVERHENYVRMNGIVVFKNALFKTDVIAALSQTEIWDAKEKKYEQLTHGQMKLTNEELLLEDLPIVIDRAPGLLG